MIEAIQQQTVTEPTQLYWSRMPGKFVDPQTGEKESHELLFTGSVMDWYDTLVYLIVRVLEQHDIVRIYASIPELYTVLSLTHNWSRLRGGLLFEEPTGFHRVYNGQTPLGSDPNPTNDCFVGMVDVDGIVHRINVLDMNIAWEQK